MAKTQTRALPGALQELLRQPAYGHVITFNAGGSPQVSVVWMDVVDGRPSFNTVRGRKKVENLERDPRIIVSVRDPRPEKKQAYAVFHGRARLVESGAEEQIDALANKFFGMETYPWRAPGERRVTVIVDVERIAGNDEQFRPWPQERPHREQPAHRNARERTAERTPRPPS